MEPRDSLPNHRSDDANRNRIEIYRFFAFLGMALFFASWPQTGEILAALRILLLASAVICGTAAIIAKEQLSPHHLTRWDVAAALLDLSIFSKIATA
jgi:hypothetical protein